MAQDLVEVGTEEGFLFLSSKQLVDEEICWQFGMTGSLPSSSQYVIVEKDVNLQSAAETRRKRGGCGSRLADLELELQLKGHKEVSSECGSLCCPYCEQKKLIDSSVGLFDRGAVGNATPLQNQYHKRQQRSSEGTGMVCSNSAESSSVVGKPARLGSALCLSQARARNAEKLASEALIEKEELAKLFFKEANTCRTYKKRIQLLELENLWLKRNVENDSEVCVELPSYFITSASRHCKFYKRGFSKDSSLAQGTLGLAFALGLSCASAGFVIGCCMGLAGLSH